MDGLSVSRAHKHRGPLTGCERERKRDGIGIVEVQSVATIWRVNHKQTPHQTQHRLVNMNINDMAGRADGRIVCIKST